MEILYLQVAVSRGNFSTCHGKIMDMFLNFVSESEWEPYVLKNHLKVALKNLKEFQKQFVVCDGSFYPVLSQECCSFPLISNREPDVREGSVVVCKTLAHLYFNELTRRC